MECTHCFSENPREASYCQQCGLPLRDSQDERRQLTVLFCDLVGSTALSYELDPEEYRDLIRKYQTHCAEIVRCENGHVAQYLGDGILVYFGYPEAHEDDSRRAIRAGLTIVTQISGLHLGRRPLQVRIGIHTGVVVVGPLGSGPSSQRLAVGVAPNIAARVQAQAEPNQVLVTETTRHLVAGYFVFDPLGSKVLAGTGKAMPLFRVVTDSGARSRLEAARAVGLSPLIGRHLELDFVLDRLEAKSIGGGGVLVLTGEPGIGKSRLFDVVVDEAASRGFRSLRAYCSPQHDNSPLHPVMSLFSQWLGPTGLSQPTTTAVRKALDSEGPDDETEELASALLEALEHRSDSVVPVTPQPIVTPQKRLRFVFDTIRRWISHLALARPLVLLVEDVHWADPTTLDLIDSLIDVPHANVLVCLNARPEFQATWLQSPLVRRIHLGPLSQQDAGRLVSAIVGWTVPEKVAAGIYLETDGIPLFVEEVARARLEAGLFGSAHSEGSSDGLGGIPARLYEPLMARLDRMGSAKLLAQRASVLGREFSANLLAQLADSDDAETRNPEGLARDLAALTAAGLIARREGSSEDAIYVFKHALIRDAAYTSLLRSVRHDLHRLAASALLSANGGGRDHDVIAMHLEEGGKAHDAVHHRQLAATNALRRGAPREAIAHLQRALALVERPPPAEDGKRMALDLHLLIASAFMSINGWSARSVEESCQKALDLSNELGAHTSGLQALWGLWSVRAVRGEAVRALAAAERLLASARIAQSPSLIVMASQAMTFSLYCHGRCLDVERHAREGIALYSLEQEKFIIEHLQGSSTVVLIGLLAVSLWLQGRSVEAEECIAHSDALAQELGHAPSLATHLSFRAELHLWQHDAERLQRTAERQLQLATTEGFELYVPIAHCYRGLARAFMGYVDEGLAEASSGAAAYAAIGAGMNLTHEHCVRGELLARAGRHEEAVDLLDRAESRSEEFGERNCKAELFRVRGEIYAARHEQDRATSVLRTAIQIATEQGAAVLASRAGASLSQITASQGDEPEELRDSCLRA